MKEDEVRSLVAEIITGSVLPTALQLLKSSEDRMARTNEMVNRLADATMATCAGSENIRAMVQELIAANMELTKRMLDLQKDYDRYRSEIRVELAKANDNYIHLSEEYVRLASRKDSGSRAEVTIAK